MESYSSVSKSARAIADNASSDEIRLLAELIVKLSKVAEGTNTVAKDAQQTARFAESVARSN